MAVLSQPGTPMPELLAVTAWKHLSWTDRAKKEAPVSSSHRLVVVPW